MEAVVGQKKLYGGRAQILKCKFSKVGSEF